MARGRRLVDEHGRPLRADEIEQEAFYTAYPEDADREQYRRAARRRPARPARARPARRPRRAGRRDGIVAYSKICTHAGCAVSLYRVPTFAPVRAEAGARLPVPLLDVRPGDAAATVLFGPAGRPLPQLPLAIDASGNLRAAGNFTGAVGPSWWGVRSRRPNA